MAAIGDLRSYDSDVKRKASFRLEIFSIAEYYVLKWIYEVSVFKSL